MGPSRFPQLSSRRGWRKENESESSGDSDGDSQDHSDASSGDEDSFVQDGVVGEDASSSDTKDADPLPETEDNCGDEVDNDGDGVADCLDPDCAGIPPCLVKEPEDCGNGIDDDQDGAVDCEDPDCQENCGLIEDCSDPVDNDGDGQGGCLDSDCANSPECQEVCGDGIDNNGDGLVDCQDPVCGATPLCSELCDDGQDNDGDGQVDCEDVECIGADPCIELDCGDGADNDGDGLIDCLDPDCLGTLSCTSNTCFPVYTCLLEQGCNCTAGVDCPDELSDQGSLCQATCVESETCFNSCIESLNPDVQSAAQAWFACMDTECADVPTSQFTACVNTQCVSEYAQCFATGDASCSWYGFECGETCADLDCIELCLGDLSAFGLEQALLWDQCRYSACDGDSDGEADSLECLFLSSFYSCMNQFMDCLPFPLEGGTGCGTLLDCATACPPTDEECHLGCLSDATPSALVGTGLAIECILETCGTTAAGISGGCVEDAKKGACFSQVQQCILSP